MSVLTEFMAKSNQRRTKWCLNHPVRMIEDKYDVCFHCWRKDRLSYEINSCTISKRKEKGGEKND